MNLLNNNTNLPQNQREMNIAKRSIATNLNKLYKKNQ